MAFGCPVAAYIGRAKQKGHVVKTCSSCKKKLPLDSFYVKPNGGPSSRCKICARAITAQWKKDNPDSVKRNRKKYREKHRAKLRDRGKEYREKNADKIKEYLAKPDVKSRRKHNSKQWACNNPESRKQTLKQYYAANKETQAPRRKAYKQRTRDRANMLARKRRQENIEEHRKKQREIERRRRETDVDYRVAKALRGRVRDAIKTESKAASTQKLLGCTVPELKQHLESKFQPGMSWDNYTKDGWHIDHIIPCAAKNPDGTKVFDFSKPEDQKKCFHWTNLQPMWAKENYKKKNKIQRSTNAQ